MVDGKQKTELIEVLKKLPSTIILFSFICLFYDLQFVFADHNCITGRFSCPEVFEMGLRYQQEKGSNSKSKQTTSRGKGKASPGCPAEAWEALGSAGKPALVPSASAPPSGCQDQQQGGGAAGTQRRATREPG